VAAAPDPSGHHDDLDGAPSTWVDWPDGYAVVVPDDARTLEADRLAYLRELAVAEGGRPHHRHGRRRLGPRGLPAPVLIAGVLVLMLVGSLMTLLEPRPGDGPLPRPLATAVSQDPGQVGGLIPDVTVSVGSLEVLARAIRPAVLLFVPPGCTDCADVVSSVVLQVRSRGLPLVLVGPPAQERTLLQLASKVAGEATVAVDHSSRLVQAFGQEAPSVTFVAADGTVTAIERRISPSTGLDPDLRALVRASTS